MTKNRAGAIGLLAAGAVAGGVLAGTLSASAADGGTTTTPPSYAAPAAGTGAAAGHGPGGASPVRSDESTPASGVVATLTQKAEAKVSGATVIRGVMGYGSSSEIHSSKFWELSEKLPMIVEVADTPENIDRYLDVIMPILEKVRYGCLVTREETGLVLNKTGRKK